MTDHWDWLQTAATGEWKIYVGQDDGLLEEFFEIAHELVSIQKLRKRGSSLGQAPRDQTEQVRDKSEIEQYPPWLDPKSPRRFSAHFPRSILVGKNCIGRMTLITRFPRLNPRVP